MKNHQWAPTEKKLAADILQIDKYSDGTFG